MTEIIARARPAIVLIGTQTGCGSGTIFRSDGYILTNWHVIEGYTQVAVTVGENRTLAGQVVGFDATLDLAVVKIAGSAWSFISISGSRRPEVGEKVIVLGYPVCNILSVQARATQGIVSGYQNIYGDDRIQTDADITGGNSGGAALNANGEYIGVPTWTLVASEDIGFFTGFFNTATAIPGLVAGTQIGSPGL